MVENIELTIVENCSNHNHSQNEMPLEQNYVCYLKAAQRTLSKIVLLLLLNVQGKSLNMSQSELSRKFKSYIEFP